PRWGQRERSSSCSWTALLSPGSPSSPTLSDSDNETVTLTCPSCKVSVDVSGRARFRQICPYCGNFYNAAAQTDPSLRTRRGAGHQIGFPAIDNQRFSSVVVQRFGRVNGSPGLTHITEVYITDGRRHSDASQSSDSLPPLVARFEFYKQCWERVHSLRHSPRSAVRHMMRSANRLLDSIRQLVVPSRRSGGGGGRVCAIGGGSGGPAGAGSRYATADGDGQPDPRQARVPRSRTLTCPVSDELQLRPRRCSFPEVFLTIPENSLPASRTGSAASQGSSSCKRGSLGSPNNGFSAGTALSLSSNNLSLAGALDGQSIKSVRSVDIGLNRALGDDLLDVGPNYPDIELTVADVQDIVKQTKESGKPDEMLQLYADIFGTLESICATFKLNPEQDGARAEDPGLKFDLIYAAMDGLLGARSVVHKNLLKSIINTMMQENRKMHEKDELRALFILLMTPIFASQSSYTVFAHLLRQITSLPNGDHQLLVGWFKLVKRSMFESMVQHLLQFITVRQFPPADISLPPLGKSRWWIPTATKVLALLNVANNKSVPPIVKYTYFYNSTLDHLDLMQEYYNWQAPDRPDRFSFCQYPFILSIVAKRYILTKDSEQQMIQTARRSLVAKVSRHQVPDIDIFFLNIHVRRNHLVADSLKEIGRKQRDLKKKLKVSFEGEPGLDMGGLTKEWFLLLVRHICSEVR
ncbi:unnamed protein product, partial [Notodromas monacha]